MDDNPYRTEAVGASDVAAVNSLERRRPVGIVLVALVHLVNGVFIAGQRAYMLVNVYSTSEGPVTMSGPFKAMLFGEVTITVVAIASAVGLYIGAKWGWWLGAFHWTWRISREVLLPLVATVLAGLSSEFVNGAHIDIFRTISPLVIQGLLLLYFFHGSVLSYFGLTAIWKMWAILALFGAGFLTALVLNVLRSIMQ